MSVIEGASVSVKTMSDGTLRLSIDIEPRNAQAAFILFGAPGRAVALAALVDGHGAVQEQSEPVKGRHWAKLAGMWCEDADFWAFMESTGVHTVRDPASAADAVRAVCRINTRAELDHDARALEVFNSQIRYPFMRWMQARRIKK